MNVLLLDSTGWGLDFGLRCNAAGHHARLCIGRDDDTGMRNPVGDGLIEKIENEEWQKSMNWADLVVHTDNNRWLRELDVYKRKGYPILAASYESAKLELNRGMGQELLKKHGCKVIPYETFTNYKRAEEYVISKGERMVSKPDGDKATKDLSYVSQSTRDMVYMLRRWSKKFGDQVARRFMLQEFVSGVEFAVNGWLGPKGFASYVEENFEHKKLMNDDKGPNCYSEDTEVLTSDGWKFWPEVRECDAICTLRDGMIEFEIPSRLVVQDFDGEMVGWQSHYVDILVTPDHSMYVQDDHSRKDFFFETAQESETTRRNVLRGAGKWIGEDHAWALPRFYATGKFYAWCGLIGAYIADGYARNRSVVFGNCPPHKQRIFKDLAERAGFIAKMYGNDLYINSAPLAEYCRGFGQANEKIVPDYIMNATPESIGAFLYGYGAGDGTTTGSLVYTTVSKRLADQLQELCLKAGWCANIRTRDRVGESHFVNGYECINRFVSYDVAVSQKRMKAEINPNVVYRLPYRGKVYCCTVSSHIIYVRRNGKSCFLGQCGEMGTVMKYTQDSALAKEVLLPLEGDLIKMGHTGSVDVSVIIDENGEPRPLEFTCRLGWPAFHIAQALHPDPCEWMADLIDGVDNFQPSTDVAVGVVLATSVAAVSGSNDKIKRKDLSGVPIYDLDESNPYRQGLSPVEVSSGTAPDESDVSGQIDERRLMVSAGGYLIVATGAAPTVREAKAEAYKAAASVEIPNSVLMRTDIGDRCRSDIPRLQSFGFASDWEY